MTRHERAAQLWPLLVLAARNRQILTYEMVSQLTGVPRVAVGGFLAPIQDYCLNKKLPALTILVVSEDTGMPGEGFIAAQDIPKEQARVFAHDLPKQQAPTPQDMEATFGRSGQ